MATTNTGDVLHLFMLGGPCHGEFRWVKSNLVRYDFHALTSPSLGGNFGDAQDTVPYETQVYRRETVACGMIIKRLLVHDSVPDSAILQMLIHSGMEEPDLPNHPYYFPLFKELDK